MTQVPQATTLIQHRVADWISIATLEEEMAMTVSVLLSQSGCSWERMGLPVGGVK